MKDKAELDDIYSKIKHLLVMLLALPWGCGTWVESSGEEDGENSNSDDRGDGGANNDMGDPSESVPLPDGFEFIDPPEDENIENAAPHL